MKDRREFIIKGLSCYVVILLGLIVDTNEVSFVIEF